MLCFQIACSTQRFSKPSLNKHQCSTITYHVQNPKNTRVAVVNQANGIDKEEEVEEATRIFGKDDVEVMKGTAFSDGRYGQCHVCDGHIVIPGLAHYLCGNCGWIIRPVNSEIIAPTSHHE